MNAASKPPVAGVASKEDLKPPLNASAPELLSLLRSLADASAPLECCAKEELMRFPKLLFRGRILSPLAKPWEQEGTETTNATHASTKIQLVV